MDDMDYRANIKSQGDLTLLMHLKWITLEKDRRLWEFWYTN